VYGRRYHKRPQPLRNPKDMVNPTTKPANCKWRNVGRDAGQLMHLACRQLVHEIILAACRLDPQRVVVIVTLDSHDLDRRLNTGVACAMNRKGLMSPKGPPDQIVAVAQGARRS
jgi:hypothetical protein